MAAILSSEEISNVLVAKLGAKIPERVRSVAATRGGGGVNIS